MNRKPTAPSNTSGNKQQRGVNPASGSSARRTNTPGGTKPKPPAKAAAPPTNPAPKKGKTDESCAKCQAAGVKACDVDTLELKAEKEGENEVRVLIASKKMRQAANATEKKTYPKHIHGDLANFDLIIDCTAGFKDNYFKATPTPVIQQLSAEATYHRAGKCPNKHPILLAKVSNGDAMRVGGSSKGKSANLVNWPDEKSDDAKIKGATGVWPPKGEERRFLANSVFEGNAKEPNDFTALFYLVFALMDAQNPKRVIVNAIAHGCRIDGKPVRESLYGLFRIYRDDVIKVTVAAKGPGREYHKEPPAKAASPEDTKKLKDYQEKAEANAKPPKVVKERKNKTLKQGFVDIIKVTKPTEPGIEIKVTINDDYEVKVDSEKTQQAISMLKKAGRTAKFIGGLKGMSQDSLGFFLAVLWDVSVMVVRDNLKNFITALKNCVKYGLWLDFDFGFLDAAVGFKYAAKPGKDYPRYKSIAHGWSFYGEIDLFHAEVSLNFGVQAKFPPIGEFWAYVYVKLSGKLTLGVEVSLDSQLPGTAKVEGTSEPELGIGASGGANVLGAGVSVNAEAKIKFTVKVGIEITHDASTPDPKTKKPKKIQKFSTSGVINPIVLDYQGQLHSPGFPPRAHSGQWYPWGNAPKEIWKRNIP